MLRVIVSESIELLVATVGNSTVLDEMVRIQWWCDDFSEVYESNWV